MSESKGNPPGSGLRKAAACATLLFALMSAAFLARGLQQLLPANSATQAKDLRTNWTETHLVLHRQSPYGDAAPSPYPPWTFAAAILFYGPGWPAVKLWFLLINIACLLLLAAWAWRAVPRGGPWTAPLAAASVMAISSIATGLGLGQNAILYTAFLAAAFLSYERGWRILSGLLLGIAMSKISIALPFALPFLFRKEIRVLAAAAVYIAGATLLLAWWIHSTPWQMLEAWIPAAQRNNGIAYGPASLLVWAGAPAGIATRGCAALFLGAAVATFVALQKLPMLTLFGLASGFGRLWIYHRVYDNVMLAFLLVALAAVYLRTKSRAAAAAWLLVGFTLWYPIHAMDVPIVHLIHVLIWLAAMVILAMADRRPAPPGSTR